MTFRNDEIKTIAPLHSLNASFRPEHFRTLETDDLFTVQNKHLEIISVGKNKSYNYSRGANYLSFKSDESTTKVKTMTI